MPTADEILAAVRDRSKRRETTVRVLLDGTLAQRFAEAEQALADRIVEAPQEALGEPSGQVAELMGELAAVQADADAAAVEFRLQALSFREWADLVAEHPPTQEQARENPNVDFNPDTFAAAIVAASCIDPVFTVEQAAALLDELHPAQHDRLWVSALALNRGDGGVPKSRLLAGNGPDSNDASAGPPTGSASLAASSSDG